MAQKAALLGVEQRGEPAMDLGNKLWDTWQSQLGGTPAGQAKTGRSARAGSDAKRKEKEKEKESSKSKGKIRGKKERTAAAGASTAPTGQSTSPSSIFDDFFSDSSKKQGNAVPKRSSWSSTTSGKPRPFRMGHSVSESVDEMDGRGGTGGRRPSATPERMHRTQSPYVNLDHGADTTAAGSSYADKFMERIIAMAIPTTTTSSKRELDRILGRIEMQRSRPQLSMQIMSRNSILLLQRLSIPFETIDVLISFFNWKNPTLTITGMLFLTLCILKPINLLTLPLFYICFEIIIPAYTVQNPNTDEGVHGWEDELPKPVNEFTREFLLNVTDLQNHMLLYVNAWDFANAWCWKLFYFRDEMLTWLIFVSLLVLGLLIETFGTSAIAFCFPLIKLSLVVFSWLLIIITHPKNRTRILEAFYSEELRLKTMSLLNYYESKVINDIDLTSDQMEIRQIEIYELQYYNDDLKAWQFSCFSKDIYPPNSHVRLNSMPIEGTATLESIVAPDGWKFVNASDLLHSSPDDSTGGNGDASGNESNKSPHGFEGTRVGKNRHSNSNTLLLFDYEKKRMQKEKRKYQKYLKKQKKLSSNTRGRPQSQEFIIENTPESSQSNLQRRRASNDFNNILLDPLTLNKTLVEQLETGVNLEGWYLDLCPDNWVINNYLQSVLEVDEDSKWVYDLVVMGNGVDAYKAGLGLTNGKLKRSRGDVRRRRWVRYAVREIVQGIHSDVVLTEDEEEEEDDDDEGDDDDEKEEEEEEEGDDEDDTGDAISDGSDATEGEEDAETGDDGNDDNNDKKKKDKKDNGPGTALRSTGSTTGQTGAAAAEDVDDTERLTVI